MYTKTAQKKENTNNFSLPLFFFSPLIPPFSRIISQKENYYHPVHTRMIFFSIKKSPSRTTGRQLKSIR